jgi:hypothetical protein
VRVHSDPLAARSAGEVEALAYTVGQDVVFAAGQYNPGTAAGRRLLAHELVHTVQQDQGPVVRRQTASLTVEGLYEGRGADRHIVYFDYDQPDPGDVPPESALDPDERTKAEDKAREAVAAGDQDMSLYGFASEEGGAAHNNPLIDRRLTAVQNVLEGAGFRPSSGTQRTIHRHSNLACSAGKFNYRFWRAVEMQRGTAPQSRPCNPTAAPLCPSDRMTQVQGIRQRALDLFDGPTGALNRLARFIQNPADEPDVGPALDRFFGGSHTAQTAQAVQQRLTAIRSFINGLGSSSGAAVKCGGEDEPTCRAGATALADSSEVIFCQRYFDDPRLTAEQVPSLIHESAHGSTAASDDRAYRHERVMPLLTTAQALENAESLAGFVMELAGSPIRVGPANPDVVSGCDPQGGNRRETIVRQALAWAERWNTYAFAGLAQTYNNAGHRASMAPFHRAHFGRDDIAAIAGLFDRYRAMFQWFLLFYNVVCAQPGDPACSGSRRVSWTLTRAASPAGGGPAPLAPPAPTGGSTTPSAAPSSTGASSAGSSPQTGQPPGAAPAPSAGTASSAPASSTAAPPAAPAGTITVCPGFFSLGTLYDRAIEMHSGLAVHLPGVTEGTSRSYGRLAFNYMTQFWGVQP